MAQKPVLRVEVGCACVALYLVFRIRRAYDFLGMIIDFAGGSASDRMAFKSYALQRLHAANFRGVAAVINSRPGDSHGACVPPPRVWPAAPGDRPP